jgi:C-8 sterol isomerase
MVSLRFLAFLPILYFVYTWLDSQLPNHYIFSPEKLQELSQNAIANNPDGNVTNIFTDLVDGLRETYGEKHVNLVRDEDWFFNNAVSIFRFTRVMRAKNNNKRLTQKK